MNNIPILTFDLIVNNIMIQKLFTCQLHLYKYGLKQLTKNEIRSNSDLNRINNDNQKLETEAQMTLSWINSLLPNNFEIFDLYRDLSDGFIVVELMESANACCVEWKN